MIWKKEKNDYFSWFCSLKTLKLSSFHGSYQNTYTRGEAKNSTTTEEETKKIQVWVPENEAIAEALEIYWYSWRRYWHRWQKTVNIYTVKR